MVYNCFNPITRKREKNNMGYDWKSGRQFGHVLEKGAIGNLLENIWKKKEDLPSGKLT